MIRTFICARIVTAADPRVEVPEDHEWSKETKSPHEQRRPSFYVRCPDHDGLGGGDGPDENNGRPLTSYPPSRGRRGKRALGMADDLVLP